MGLTTNDWARTWAHYCQLWIDWCVKMEGKWWHWRHISSYASWMNFWMERHTRKCKLLGAMYVQAIEDSLNESVLNLLVLNASKLVSQKYYPSDEEARITMSKQWLEKLFIKSRSTTVESNASRAKLLEFVKTLKYEYENKSLYKAWQLRGDINEWYTNWPHLMKLWQKNTCHSLKYCNLWKGNFKTKWYKKPLKDALMRASLCGIKLEKSWFRGHASIIM